MVMSYRPEGLYEYSYSKTSYNYAHIDDFPKSYLDFSAGFLVAVCVVLFSSCFSTIKFICDETIDDSYIYLSELAWMLLDSENKICRNNKIYINNVLFMIKPSNHLSMNVFGRGILEHFSITSDYLNNTCKLPDYFEFTSNF